MAYLVNRNPPARAQCLHAICKLSDEKFPDRYEKFQIKDIKYDPSALNIFKHCQNLLTDEDLGLSYCPYKENPLSDAGCSLTNGVEEDSTKSKEASNTVNSLHTLGLFTREKNGINLTELGRKFAATELNTDEFSRVFRDAALNSGLMIGFLGQIFNEQNQSFSTSDIYVGYPNTGQEKILVNGETIVISSGSEKDSNTRTKSCLLAWGITAGFFAPKALAKKDLNTLQEYVSKKSRNLQEYVLKDFPYEIFESGFITTRPLDYRNLTKSTKALRERNQDEIRNATLSVEPKIRNRRLAIILALSVCFKKNLQLNYATFINHLAKYEDFFVVNRKSFEEIMLDEIKISFVAGIPYRLAENFMVVPLVGINENELLIDAPADVVKAINEYFNE